MTPGLLLRHKGRDDAGTVEVEMHTERLGCSRVSILVALERWS